MTTCTNSKRGNIDKDLHLRHFSGTPPEQTVNKWHKFLTRSEKLGTVPAAEVYSGAHWKESLATEVNGNEIGYQSELWVLSAGYSLIKATEKITPYAASFSPGEDSIHNLAWPDEYSPADRSREWWKLLSKKLETPKLSIFKKKKKDSTVLLILSKEYFKAIENEIIELISSGTNLFIVSAGLYRESGTISPIVKPYILPFNDSFKQLDPYLNNTNVSLNVRLCNWLIKRYGKNLSEGIEKIFPMIDKIRKGLPEPKRKPLIPMTDDEVLTYISKNYSSELGSASKMLRQLRDVDQLSCEQKRFGQLFKKYINSIQGELF